jgi:DHA2 family multidrug resistance protein-like MFS transporter
MSKTPSPRTTALGAARPEARRRSEDRPAPTDAAAPDGLLVPRRRWAAATIWAAIAMTVLDGAIANVALPTIARALHASPAESIWVVNAYQLAIVVSLLPMAALGEIVGYRRIYQAGLLVFTLASLSCALSHSLAALTAARFIQGFGAAGIMSVNGALVRYTYPHSMLGRGVGLNALVVAVSAAAGPTIASAILSTASWPWLFAVNVPIGIATLAVAACSLPGTPLAKARFDLFSAGLNALAFGLLVTGVDVLTRTRARLAGLVELALGLVSGWLLVRRELHADRPLVPVDLLRIRIFALSIVTSVISFTAQMGAFVSLPFQFEMAMHRSQVQTGLLLTPWPIGVGIAAPMAGWLADRFSAAILGGIGLLVFAAGLGLLASLPTEASNLEIAWRMLVCGMGFGFFQSPNNRMMLSTAPRERAGAAGGMLATARLTGQTMGAVLIAVCLHLFGDEGERITLWTGAILALAGAGSSTLRLVRHKAPDHPEPEVACEA